MGLILNRASGGGFRTWLSQRATGHGSALYPVLWQAVDKGCTDWTALPTDGKPRECR